MSPALDRNPDVREQPARKQPPQQEPDVTVKDSAGVPEAASAVPDVTAEDDIEELVFSRPAHDDIALLAYCYWLDRGQPDGSPEDDWLRAERELNEQRRGGQQAGISR